MIIIKLTYVCCFIIHKGLSFIYVCHPMWGSKTPCEEHRSLVTSRKNLTIQEVKVLSQGQETEVLTLDISYGHLLGNAHCPGPSLFMPRAGQSRNLRNVSGSDYLPMSLSSEASIFWEGLYLATDILRDHGPGTSWRGQEGSPLESSGGIGGTLPLDVPPFLLLLALPWRWEQKEKNEERGLSWLAPLSRKLRYSSKINVTLHFYY